MADEIRYRVAQLKCCAIDKEAFLYYLKQIIREYCRTEEEAKRAVEICNYWLNRLIYNK